MVQEDHGATGFTDVASDLAHGLAHQASLAPNRQITHLSFNLSPRRQRSNGVDHHDVDRSRTNELIDDLKCHLTRIRLGDQEVFNINTKGSRIDRIQGVLSIDKRRHTSTLLHLSDGMQRQRGLA